MRTFQYSTAKDSVTNVIFCRTTLFIAVASSESKLRWAIVQSSSGAA